MKRFALLMLAALIACAAALPARAQFADGDVRIGVLTDMSGVYSAIGGQGSIEAARMAIEDFGDGLGEVPIELVWADHQNKADIAAIKAREWFDVDGVDAIVGIVTSSVALAVQDVGRDTGKITMASGAGTSRLTDDACAPTGFHWAYDTYAWAVGTASALLAQGGDSWYFLTVDYAFGKAMEADATRVVEAGGGRVLGAVRHPFPTADFSSFLLQAQASGAKIVGLANAGQDTINAIKQAHEFGLTEMGQQLAGLTVFISDVHALGVETAQGLLLTTAFYWDFDSATRAFSERFFKRIGAMPTQAQAGVYSSVLHYLRSVQTAGGDDGPTVAAAMKRLPVDDMFARNGFVRDDGRMVHDMYLAKVKTPEQSGGDWDLYEILDVIPGVDAYRPLAESRCPLVNAP
jgi:branched-chain amino acid transport system substrate-binding protein